MILAASIGGASWSLISLLIALILLFIAAFIVDGVGGAPGSRRISFGWAGAFFLALAAALR